VPPSRPGLLSAAWSWRYELAALASVAVGATVIVSAAGAAGLAGAAAAAVVAAGLIMATPSARRAAIARMWCIVTPHRLRTGCAQAWVYSRAGKIPVVMVTRAQPFGERVWIWCRAGTSPLDLISAREQLAAACWAMDVWVTPSARHRHIAVIDVIRRADRGTQAGAGAPWIAPGELADDPPDIGDFRRNDDDGGIMREPAALQRLA
jgi:hypothetical protein